MHRGVSNPTTKKTLYALGFCKPVCCLFVSRLQWAIVRPGIACNFVLARSTNGCAYQLNSSKVKMLCKSLLQSDCTCSFSLVLLGGNLVEIKSRVSTNTTASACSAELIATDLVNPFTNLPRELRQISRYNKYHN